MQKVLVVDDSLSVRKVVEKALEGRGLKCSPPRPAPRRSR